MKYDLAEAVRISALPSHLWEEELESYQEPRRSRIERTAKHLLKTKGRRAAQKRKKRS
jgi:hypothetical protein